MKSSSAISGKTIANSEDPADKLIELIDKINTFVGSASEYKDSLIKIAKNIDKPYNINANYELVLDSTTKTYSS